MPSKHARPCCPPCRFAVFVLGNIQPPPQPTWPRNPSIFNTRKAISSAIDTLGPDSVLAVITSLCCAAHALLPRPSFAVALPTPTQAIASAIDTVGPDRVLAVITTSSCFAPRAPDDLVGVARLCGAREVPHVVNNAYGVQSRQLCAAVSAAWNKGRVDAVVQVGGRGGHG